MWSVLVFEPIALDVLGETKAIALKLRSHKHLLALVGDHHPQGSLPWPVVFHLQAMLIAKPADSGQIIVAQRVGVSLPCRQAWDGCNLGRLMLLPSCRPLISPRA